MKIVLLTDKRQIYASKIIESIIKNKKDDIFILLSNTIMHKKTLFGSFNKIINDSGIFYFFFRILENIYGRFLVFMKKETTVSQLIKKYRIKHSSTNNINDKVSLNKIKEINPDLIISIYFNQIIGRGVLGIPRYGCINIHRALLPKDRGPSSAFWQISRNEKETGFTIHYIDSGIDSGDIIAQRKFELKEEYSLHDICKISAKIASEEILDVLENLRNGKIMKIKQNEEKSTANSFPTRQSMKDFLRYNKRFF